MIHLLTIFIVGYISVFAAGFQSRNVNSGNYGMAAVTSAVIAMMSAGIWNAITAPGAGWPEVLVYALSGATGITSAMWVHRKFVEKPKPEL